MSRITSRLAMPPWVVVGPGDDAAVITPARGALEVLTTDALVDGIHFDLRFVPPDAVGYRALAVNLSDLAAMGAEPRSALLSLLVPDDLEIETVDGVVDGLLALAVQYRVALIGGNISRTTGPLTIDVTATGSVRPRRVLTRAGAGPGDEVYVTGSLGSAATGLQLLKAVSMTEEGTWSPASLAAGARSAEVAAGLPLSVCVDRYLRPEPRVRAGMLLGRNRAASSCMDLSDGLGDALQQVAEASGVGITVNAAELPVADEVRTWHREHRRDLMQTVLGAGDDYELLFTTRPSHRGRFRSVLKQLGALRVTRIGVVTKARDVLVKDEHGTREVPRGYEHWGSSSSA